MVKLPVSLLKYFLIALSMAFCIFGKNLSRFGLRNSLIYFAWYGIILNCLYLNIKSTGINSSNASITSKISGWRYTSFVYCGPTMVITCPNTYRLNGSPYYKKKTLIYCRFVNFNFYKSFFFYLLFAFFKKTFWIQ